jgi:ATP-dependent protease HslVU (ClpYQ) ATPase subunit
MASLMEETLFQLPELPDKRIVFDGGRVRQALGALVADDDLRRYIL